MTDDIVTRLRNYDFMRDGDIPDVIMNQAADDIETLRTLADDLFYYVTQYPCLCQLLKCKCGYDAVVDSYREIRDGN